MALSETVAAAAEEEAHGGGENNKPAYGDRRPLWLRVY